MLEVHGSPRHNMWGLLRFVVVVLTWSASGESLAQAKNGGMTLEAEIGADGEQRRNGNALIRAEHAKAVLAETGAANPDIAAEPRVMLSGDGTTLSMSCAAASETANTRCCSGNGAGVQLQSNGCFANQSYVAAAEACLNKGYRLCTQAEVAAGKAKHAGCHFDAKFIWTSTPCTLPAKFWKVRGGGGTLLGPTCSTASSAANVHCCSLEGGATAQVMKGSAAGCHQAKTLAEAKAICEQNGGRVCSFDELKGGLAKSAGCSFDSTLVWSSTSCDSTAEAIQVSGNLTSHRRRKAEVLAVPAAPSAPDTTPAPAATTAAAVMNQSSAEPLEPDEYQGSLDLTVTEGCAALEASAVAQGAVGAGIAGLLGVDAELCDVDVACNNSTEKESLLEAKTISEHEQFHSLLAVSRSQGGKKTMSTVTTVTWSVRLPEDNYETTDEMISSRISLFKPAIVASEINEKLQEKGSSLTITVQQINGLQKVYNSMLHSPNTTVITTTTTTESPFAKFSTTIVPVVILVGTVPPTSITTTTPAPPINVTAPPVVTAAEPDDTIVSAAAAPPPEEVDNEETSEKGEAQRSVALIALQFLFLHLLA